METVAIMLQTSNSVLSQQIQNRRQRLYVIYNPTAGWFRRGRFLKIKAALERLGCKVIVKHTTRRGDAEHFARGVDPDKFDAVVAAGGDGTINEVVNGLAGRGIPLGIIPLGTANVLAAEIGLPLKPDDVAKAIADGPRLKCYLGRANGRRFIMMAGVGFDAHVVENVSSGLKRLIGKGAYVWTSLAGLGKYSSRTYQITINGDSIKAASVIIGNGHFYGGRYVCTPDARLENDRFQICIFSGSGPLPTIKYALGLFAGTIPNMKDVHLVESTEARIEGLEGEPVQGDGDIVARLPLDLKMDDHTIDLLVPVL